MKNDKKILREVKLLREKCSEYLSCAEISQDAYSDRVLEELIKSGEKISRLYDTNS